MENFQNPEIKRTKNKITLGKVLVKSVLVLGTVSVLGYSMIKNKLLGNPASKIRKGLLYATLAGIILYKCQGDKIKEVYDYASTNAVEVYNNFYELKKNNNKRINELSKGYEESMAKNKQLEVKISNYAALDSVINNVSSEKKTLLEENNNLEKKLNRMDEIKSQNDLIIARLKRDSIEMSNLEKKLEEEKLKKEENKKYNQQKVAEQKIINEKKTNKLSEDEYKNLIVSEKLSDEIIQYSDSYAVGSELEKISDDCGNYRYVTYVNHLPHPDVLWIISDGKMTFKDISKNYYNNKISPEIIKGYNRMSAESNGPINLGHPVALLEKGLINKLNVYKGGYPRSYDLSVDGDDLNRMLIEYYFEDSKTVNVLDAIKRYNRIYYQDIDELKNKAKDLGNRGYSILIPRFLKYNVTAGFHEFWVTENDESGEY